MLRVFLPDTAWVMLINSKTGKLFSRSLYTNFRNMLNRASLTDIVSYHMGISLNRVGLVGLKNGPKAARRKPKRGVAAMVE